MLTKREAAVISAYTGCVIGEFSEYKKYVEELLGRPLLHGEISSGAITDEIEGKSEKEFFALPIGDE